MCVVLMPVRSAEAQRAVKATCAYEKLDQARLAEALGNLRMRELLEALVGKEKPEVGGDLKGQALLVQARIDAALQAKDQESRDKLLDEAIAKLDELIKATAKAVNDEGILRHYRFILKRIVTEGITKTAPYIERLSYFQARPGDAETVAGLTKSAVARLDRLVAKLMTQRDEWTGKTKHMTNRAIWKLGDLIDEANYRGAWIRLNRGMVIPSDSKERPMLLNQAISDVRKFAGAGDDSSGVKFDSLLLSGMCARLLSELGNAESFLKRAADKDARPPIRLKAMFEMCVCRIDQKKYDEAAAAIKDFAKRGATLKIAKLAVDLQSAMLTNRLLEVRAEAVRKTDPAGADKLVEESIKVLLVFIEKYPGYREHIMDIIVGKYEGRDTKGLSPDVIVLIGVKEYTRASREARSEKGRTPDFTKAEELFGKVLADKRTGDSGRAAALWYMGLIKNIQRRNYDAAKNFREMADKFPTDPRAKNSALYAIASLRGILKEKNTTAEKMGKEFVEEYTRCLEVLVKNWGEKDPGIRSYNYELGTMYDILERNTEAKKAFNRLDPDSEQYIPSRFRILSLQAEDLFESAGSQVDRQRRANNLIRDLRTYNRRAKKYADSIAGKDKDRAAQVRGWCAECGMLVAQIMKDILDRPEKGAAEAEKAAKDWPDVPGIKRRSQEFVVRVLLETGKTSQAIKRLLSLVEKDPKDAEDLIAEAIEQIRVRIDRMEFLTDEKSRKKLAELRSAYRIFAVKLYDWARSNKKPEEMYGFKQALAGAYESSKNLDEVREALKMYRQMDKDKSGQAVNVLGMARCCRRLGMNKEAMEQYDRLAEGMKEKTPQWWRARLERLQFAIRIFADDAKSLEEIRLQIRVLQYKDRKMGGFWELFNIIDRRSGELLKKIRHKTDE